MSGAKRFKLRLLQSTALVACAIGSTAVHAQTANIDGSSANVLNLLAPYLSLNSTTAGQATLQTNLQQSIAINTGATLALQQLAISDKNLLSSATNTLGTTPTGTQTNFGVASNLAGGLPPQAPPAGSTVTPMQAVGGYGSVLGPIYVNGVSNSTATTGPLRNTVNLLVNAYNVITSTDLGVAKNYFANGAATNPSTTPPNYVPIPAVAPAGYTLPTFNGLPNTTNSVYDLAYGVTNTQPNQDVYGSSRPIQVAPSQINQFDPTALSGLATNPSFPSGHTNYAYTDSLLLGMLVPELYQSMLVRASEYANSRIVLGVHYPLDIVASRSFASYDLAQALTNPLYVNNTTTTGTAINLPTLFTQASTELRAYLAAQCGGTVAVCATSTANTTNDPYVPSAANQALYQSRLTYGLPTLTFAQAPREAAPAGGPDASILLATVYGGSTAAALALAPSGGIFGKLQTSTINQIIVNTETNAFAAFYGTPLSYWSRLDLYSAIGYFSGVTGTLTLDPADVVTTPVMVANGGTLAGNGTVASTTVASGGVLQPGAAAPGTLKISGSLVFQSGALYSVQVSPTAVSSVAVTGSATLAGNVQVTSPTGAYKFGTSTILTSSGLNGTQFGSLFTPTGVTGSLAYSRGTVQLSLASGLGQILGSNSNQRAVGAAFDAAFNSAGGSGGAQGTIFRGNVAQNLTQASGETATGSQQTTFSAMSQFTGLLLDTFVSGRSGDPMTQGGSLQFAAEDSDVSAYASTGQVRPKSERDALAMVTKAPVLQVYQPHWNVWAAGFGGSQATDGDPAVGSNKTTSRIYGGAVGADYWFSPFTVAGFAVAGGGTNFSIANTGTGHSDLIQAGVFVKHSVGAAYISGSLAYGWQDITTDRYVGIAGLDRFRAEFNANAYSGRVEGGYRFAAPWAGGVGITPYAAGQFTTFDLPTYAEQVLGGANTFALTYSSSSVTDTRSELGLRFDKSFAMTDGVLTLRGRAAWAHDFDPSRSIGATFQTLPVASFVVNGAAQANDSALTTASIEMKWLNHWAVAATFEGEFSDVTRSYAGKGVVRYTW